MHAIRFCVALVFVMGFSSSSEASEPRGEVEAEQYTQELSRSEERAIIRAVEGYAKGFVQEDIRLLLDLWDDRNARKVSYVAAELDQPIVGRSNLRPYYQSFLDTLIVVSGDISNVQISPLRDDLVHVFCNYNWVYQVRSGGNILTQQTRATFVLQKRGGRWLYEHFHESISFDYEPPTAAAR